MSQQHKNLLQLLGMPLPEANAQTANITTLPQPVARPLMSGNTADIEKMFSGARVVIDEEFKEFIAPLNGVYHDLGRVYDVFQTDETSQSDTAIIQKFNISRFLDPNEACATIAWLNTEEGKPYLALPEEPNNEDEYETNFILGYISKGQAGEEKLYVVFIERELEKGEEEVHIHVRRANRWRTDCPKGIYELQGLDAV